MFNRDIVEIVLFAVLVLFFQFVHWLDPTLVIWGAMGYISADFVFGGTKGEQ